MERYKGLWERKEGCAETNPHLSDMSETKLIIVVIGSIDKELLAEYVALKEKEARLLRLQEELKKRNGMGLVEGEGGNYTWKSVAEAIGISQTRAKQIYDRALKSLRKKLQVNVIL